MLEMTSDGLTNVLEHVTSNIACGLGQRYTKKCVFWLALNDIVHYDIINFSPFVRSNVISDDPTNRLSINFSPFVRSNVISDDPTNRVKINYSPFVISNVISDDPTNRV